jgi:hypothetical protein
LVQCGIEFRNPLPQPGDLPPQEFSFRAQRQFGASVQAVGDELWTVQAKPLDEEGPFRRDAIQAGILTFNGVCLQIVAQRMKQGNVGGSLSCQ